MSRQTWNLPWTDSTVPGAAELTRYADWAGKLLDINITRAQWNARIASKLSDCDHNEEALAKCMEVDLDGPDVWPVLLKAAEVSSKLGKYEKALEYLHRIKSNYLHLLDHDAAFKKAYWITMLWEEGHTHWYLKEFEKAEACFLQILDNETDTDAIAGHQNAMANLFELWEQRKAYSSVVDRLRRWASATESSKDTGHWFLLLHSDGGFHKRLVSTITNYGEGALICEAYERTLADLDPRKQRREMRHLRHHYAAVKYQSSTTAAERSIAFDNWEDVIFTSGDKESSWSPAFDTVTSLAQALLNEAKLGRLDPMSEAVPQYVEMLENVVLADLAVVQSMYSGNDDPRLTLIRLRCLAGDHGKAKELATAALRANFDGWPATSDARALIDRYSKIGQILNVLGDDKNAMAAWGLLQPNRPRRSAAESAVEGAPQEVDDQGPTAACPGETSAKDDSNAETPLNGEAKDKSDSSDAKNQDPFADLTSDVFHRCDGCNYRWKAMSDAYVCKDCLDLQLCPTCYRKHMNDGVTPRSYCRKDHDFLYLPPFDRKRWEQMGPEMMMLGEDVVSRKAWLDGIREQWGLQQDRVDEQKLQLRAQLQAAKVLTRWRKTLLKVRAATY